MTKRAFIYPGQGSQSVGMGKDLSENFAIARETFEEVNDALGLDLTKIMFDGPVEDLNLTEYTQPALMAVSVAVTRILRQEGGIGVNPDTALCVAGHSLGEYSALKAVGALSLTDTAKLLQIRGRAMQSAVPVGQGGMAAILGLEFDQVDALVRDYQGDEEAICEAANDNAPGQIVISGHLGAVEAVSALATDAGARKAVMLPVSAPFHCRLMAPAAQKMASALADTLIHPPRIPVIANVTAQLEDEPNRLRQLLVEQITERVRWRESVAAMAAAGVEEVVELGTGKVLCGLVKRINKEIKTHNAGTVEELKTLIATLNHD